MGYVYPRRYVKGLSGITHSALADLYCTERVVRSVVGNAPVPVDQLLPDSRGQEIE